ncbi:MAG: hypothetical protein FWF01_01590 [Alphaproteobacteria bacterium]|nr:hypothetical protein [Alphaproteobacteria bacterium]
MTNWILVNSWLFAALWCVAIIAYIAFLLKTHRASRLSIAALGLAGTLILTAICLASSAGADGADIAKGVLWALVISAFAAAAEFAMQVFGVQPITSVSVSGSDSEEILAFVASENAKLRRDMEDAMNIMGENFTDVGESLARNHKKLAEDIKTALENNS